MRGLTALFGMGKGVALSLWSAEKRMRRSGREIMQLETADPKARARIETCSKAAGNNLTF